MEAVHKAYQTVLVKREVSRGTATPEVGRWLHSKKVQRLIPVTALNSFPAPPVCWDPPTAPKHAVQVVVINLRLNWP